MPQLIEFDQIRDAIPVPQPTAFIQMDKILYIDSILTLCKMLPSSYRQPYQEFLEALTELLHTTTADHPEQVQLREKFQKVQQGFQQQIASLSGDELDPAVVPRWQSLQTETNRQMRLLEMDLIFLQASRQSATTQTRQAAMNSRIQTLIGYCEVLLQTE